jgi:hypothetical protein
MRRKTMKRLAVLSVALVLTLAMALPVAAGGDRITRGDVTKTFWALDRSTEGRIGLQNNGDVFCDEDWHVLMLSVFDAATKEGRATLQATEVTILLDGNDAPATKQTAIRSFLRPADNGKQIIRSWGKFLAPGSLALGSHSYRFEVTFPDSGPAPLGPFQFTLDPSAC